MKINQNKIPVEIKEVLLPMISFKYNFFSLEINFELLDLLDVEYVVYTTNGYKLFTSKSYNQVIHFCNENEYQILTNNYIGDNNEF
jgi:hypothetical protein